MAQSLQQRGSSTGRGGRHHCRATPAGGESPCAGPAVQWTATQYRESGLRHRYPRSPVREIQYEPRVLIRLSGPVTLHNPEIHLVQRDCSGIQIRTRHPICPDRNSAVRHDYCHSGRARRRTGEQLNTAQYCNNSGMGESPDLWTCGITLKSEISGKTRCQNRHVTQKAVSGTCSSCGSPTIAGDSARR